MARRFAPRRPWQAAFVLAAIPESDTGHPPPRPRIVKRVLDAMHGDPSRPWTAGDMAEVAGVSIRRLQEGFRDYVGASPRECLSDIRLTRVRDDLLRGDDGFTVADIGDALGIHAHRQVRRGLPTQVRRATVGDPARIGWGRPDRMPELPEGSAKF